MCPGPWGVGPVVSGPGFKELLRQVVEEPDQGIFGVAFKKGPWWFKGARIGTSRYLRLFRVI